MTISNQHILMINVIFIVLFLITLIKAYLSGFVATLIELVATIALFVVVAPLSSVLSKMIVIVPFKINEGSQTLLEKFIQQNINRAVWFIIIFVVGAIVLKLTAKLTKKLNDVVVIGTVNKLLGLLLGFIITIFYAIVFGVLINSPFIKNGIDVKNKTVLKYYDLPIQYTKKYVTSFSNEILAKAMSNEATLTEKEATQLFDFLIQQGISTQEINKLLQGMKK